MTIPDDIIVRVAHADVVMHMAFSSSVRGWQRRVTPWKRFPGNCEHVSLPTQQIIEIDGDCTHGISAPDGGWIHINGDLTSEVNIDGHYELIVAGNVTSEAVINAAGFCHVFVGGDFSGKLISSCSSKIWICRDFQGVVETGMPSAQLHVGRNYAGRIMPSDRPALLSLNVDGYASDESLTAIADCYYTVFDASIGISNVRPGLYPKSGFHRQVAGSNCRSRWSVATQKGDDRPHNDTDSWTPDQN